MRVAAVVLILGASAMAAEPKGDGGTMLPSGEALVGAAPADAVNLLPNGGFDQADDAGDGPAHWQSPDGLVVRWIDDADRGKVIRIDTDVYQKQAYAWWVRRYVHGAALDQAPAKQLTSGPKYDTIAGLDGGFYWSDPIEVKTGGAYRVYVDAKGGKAKVFIRGYIDKPEVSFGDEAPAVQEVFRAARGLPMKDDAGRPIKHRLRYRYTTWFAVGGTEDWQTFTHQQPRHPNDNELTEDVRWIRIMIYPYWPPGVYWFDNVRIVEVDEPRDAPQADEADIEEGKVIRRRPPDR